MRWRLVMSGLLLSIAARSGAADVLTFKYGTPDSLLNHASSFHPADSLIEARIVFVSFPGNAVQTLPTWADTMRSTLADFMTTMSRGRQQLNVSILRRPYNTDRA